MPIEFAEISVATPTRDSLAARYGAIEPVIAGDLEQKSKLASRYAALCGRGGSAPFRSASLNSPFAPGALAA